eukprot:g4415.t2
MLVLKNCRMLQMAKTLGAMRHKHLDPDSVNRGIVMHAMRNEGWESGLSLLDGGASEKAHRHLSVQLWKDMLDTSLQPDEISAAYSDQLCCHSTCTGKSATLERGSAPSQRSGQELD